jgi:hypothetical protein
MIYKYGTVGGMRIGRGNEILGDILPRCQFVYHKSHNTSPAIEVGD